MFEIFSTWSSLLRVAASVKNNTPLKQQMQPITKNALSTNDANDTIYFLATNIVQSENG